MKNRLPKKGPLIIASLLAFNASANESLPMPTIYGKFDLSVAVEMADEAAFAIEDAAGDSNYIGINGSIILDDGKKINYVHEEIMTVTSGLSFGGSYQTYLGYEQGNGEYRVGNLDLPLKKVMDKADLFSGTYADLSSVVLPNTTADSAVMYLSETSDLKYALSLDVGQNTGENANNEDATKYLRMGAMVDMKLGDSVQLAAGLENSEFSTDFGLAADFIVGEDLVLNLSASMSDRDESTPLTFTAGGYMRIGDDSRIKAQVGMQDPDTDADNAMLIALGYDKRISSNLTAYGLIALGDKGGISTTSLEQDASDAANQVLAVGVNLTF